MAAAALADLAARLWEFQCAEYPMLAIRSGVSSTATTLLRMAPADHERRKEWAREELARLAAVDAADLDVQDQATRTLLERELTLLIETVSSHAHLRPSLYPMGPDFALVSWANASALATPDEARLYVARLEGIEQSLTNVQLSLEQGARTGISYPKLVLQCAVRQARGLIPATADTSPFFAPLARAARRSAEWAELAERGRSVIENSVNPAYAAYAEFLERVLTPLARESLACCDDRDGEAFYRHSIRQYTTVDDDPQHIHALGLAEVERITGEMLKVAGEAGFEGDLPGFRRRLQTDNRQFAESAEDLREQFEVLSKRIDGLIPEYFGRTPRMTYGVKSIPEAVSLAAPPAYAQPNPADRSAAGVHWVTSIPGKCPRYMHVPLALHEAWPGHLMHLALIQEMEHLPAFRRYGAMHYSACLEGWALYSERLGEDMGLYDTPEKQYGRLEMEMWRAVRLVVDTGIHVRGWSREQAIAFCQLHMAMLLETLAAEVDRYIAWPAQALAYQLGNLKFTALRAKAESKLGSEFRIRDYHDALMAAGPVTLPVLEMLIDDWIEARVQAVPA